MKEKAALVRNYGGAYQLQIETADDLRSVLELEDARWVATSVPVGGLICDKTFLQYLDSDQNGRIRSEELRQAISWTLDVLVDTSGLEQGSGKLPLDSINTDSPDGAKIKASARLVLGLTGKEGSAEITLGDVRNRQRIMADASANGDGVIPPEGCSDEELAEFVRDVLATVGGEEDASGKQGITSALLNRFIEEARAFLAWKEGEEKSMVWKEATPSAYEALVSIRDKLDEFFAQCRLLRFEPRLQEVFELSDAEVQSLESAGVGCAEEELKKAPLAPLNPDGVLEFSGRINPLYSGALSTFRQKVVEPALGQKDKLDAQEWEGLKRTFEPYRAWLEGKRGTSAGNLPLEKLRAYLDGEFSARVTELIEADLAVADEIHQINMLEKLILYQRWLIEFSNNMVSMPRLYDPSVRPMFQRGYLVMDGRRFEFNIEVANRAEHKKVARTGKMFLMYVEVTGRDTNDKFEVAVPVTAGGAGNLAVGKRGVFFTLDGREWDARVLDIIRNPISFWEAIKAPFVSLGAFLEKQVERISSARYAELEKRLAQQVQAPRPARQAQAGAGGLAGILLGGGVAAAALGSAFAFITKTLASVKLIHIVAVVVAGVSAVLIPVAILGVIRLRRRDISALLEASGWAVNARLRLRGSLGSLLTFAPGFPEGARRQKRNIVEELARRTRRRRFSRLKRLLGFLVILILVVVFSYLFGKSLLGLFEGFH